MAAVTVFIASGQGDICISVFENDKHKDELDFIINGGKMPESLKLRGIENDSSISSEDFEAIESEVSPNDRLNSCYAPYICTKNITEFYKLIKEKDFEITEDSNKEL